MKHMSILRYANEVQQAKTRRAKLSLFLRSLSLRFVLWNTARAMRRQWRRQLKRMV